MANFPITSVPLLDIVFLTDNNNNSNFIPSKNTSHYTPCFKTIYYYYYYYYYYHHHHHHSLNNEQKLPSRRMAQPQVGLYEKH